MDDIPVGRDCIRWVIDRMHARKRARDFKNTRDTELITELIPGAGPPPHNIAIDSFIVIFLLLFRVAKIKYLFNLRNNLVIIIPIHRTLYLKILSSNNNLKKLRIGINS